MEKRFRSRFNLKRNEVNEFKRKKFMYILKGAVN